MPGSSTTPGRPSARIAHPSVLRSMLLSMSVEKLHTFRGAMAGLHARCERFAETLTGNRA